MLDNKKLRETESRVKGYVRDGIFTSGCRPEDVDFFMTNSADSLTTAKLLFDVSVNQDLQKTTGYLKFKGFLWVINSAYYSMFYAARALLEKSGVKIKSERSIHLLTFDALVYYFYLTGKLQKSLIEDYAEGKEESNELLGKEKADDLIASYYYERKKRSQFTYETGELAMQSKAKTSLERAEAFNREISKVIGKFK